MSSQGRTVMCVCYQTNHGIMLQDLPLILAKVSTVVVSTGHVRFTDSGSGSMTPALTSPSMSAEEAQRRGLVHRIVDDVVCTSSPSQTQHPLSCYHRTHQFCPVQGSIPCA